jgi:signal peptidase I
MLYLHPSPYPKARPARLCKILLGLSPLLLLGLSGCSPGKAYYIPVGSMEPTLAINDRIFVNPSAYAVAAPQRGDIVILSPTEVLIQNGYRDVLVKRIVGLPGEAIRLVAGKVYINDRPLPEPYLDANALTQVQSCPMPAWLDKPQIIPKNHYLVLGDNRPNSFDSRCWGVVPRENLVGKATMIYWPPEHYGSLEGR